MYNYKRDKPKYIIRCLSAEFAAIITIASIMIIIVNNDITSIDVIGNSNGQKVTVSNSNNISDASSLDKSVKFIPATDKIMWNVGYINSNVNLRELPSTRSNILADVNFNDEIQYVDYSDSWYQVRYQNIIGYISKEFINSQQISYTSYKISSSGFKSYMPYTAITDISSIQYIIQSSLAYTGNYGIRQVDGRYCVAVGSAINTPIGTYIDLILANNICIPCVLSDQKADEHTQLDKLTTASNGCVSEFLIDDKLLDGKIQYTGDVSSANKNWNSPVVEIRVYDKTVFN